MKLVKMKHKRHILTLGFHFNQVLKPLQKSTN